MRLEIRDVESSIVYNVDEKGAVLGRERARTDINFRDESISKRHARIYADDGIWLIEDLGSSNGTYVHDQRIDGPTALSQGVSFTLAQRRFEVVDLEGSGGPASVLDPTEGDTPEDFSGADEGAPSASVGAVLAAVPKAIAYFMISVPSMAVNPVGAINASTEKQKHPAESWVVLAAYGLVSTAVASAVGVVFGLVTSLVAGAFSVGLIIAALPTVGIAAAVGAVAGFFTHPILGWIVRILGGDSTARSRTNYALDAMTLSILTSVPSGLAAPLGLLPIPFPGLLPLLLNLLVAVLGVFLAYRWVVAFGLARWVRYVVLGLGALAVLGAAGQAVQTILEPSPTSSGGELAQLAAKAEAAAEAAEAADPSAVAVTAEGTTAPEAKPETGVAPETAASLKTKAPAAAADPDPTPTDPAPKTPTAPAKAPTPEVGTAPAPVEAAPGTSDFAVYRQRLEAIEQAIEADPSLLERRDVLEQYKPLWRITFEVREKWAKLGRRKDRWEREKIYARKEKAEVAKRTRRYVDALHRILSPR